MIDRSLTREVKILRPLWPAPSNIVAGVTTRITHSHTLNRSNDQQPFASAFGDFNLAMHVGDDANQVCKNRESLDQQLSQSACDVNNIQPGLKSTLEWRWLNQVHGHSACHFATDHEGIVTADAIFTEQKHQVCAVLTADCLPILLCAQDGRSVAAVHAGWRGLATGVISSMINALEKTGAPANKLVAWLGPAIGPNAFEVGQEVVDTFTKSTDFNYSDERMLKQAFQPSTKANHFFADIYQLATIALRQCGVHGIYGGGFCTVNDNEFYSYRRETQTGRMASFIFKTS